MNVSQKIAFWYDTNKRSLPWRESGNPYYIWLSEIILQQTRVNQGLAYYYRFIERFPTLKELASAPIDEVLLLWQGLGYYSRARNMLKAAVIIMHDYNGKIPEDYKTLLSLPGIGDYTAAAISSLAYNKPYAAIDGNVYRVLSRLFGIEGTPDSGKNRTDYKIAAEELLDKENPGRHNQAMIELGALICLPRNPHCELCPVNVHCYALINNLTDKLPVKKKDIKARHRFFYYLVIKRDNRVFLQQRKEGDIWALLHDFPMIETVEEVSLELLVKTDAWNSYLGNKSYSVKNISREYRHILSHQILHAWFIEINVDNAFKIEDTREIHEDEIGYYALPRLIERYLKDKK